MKKRGNITVNMPVLTFTALSVIAAGCSSTKAEGAANTAEQTAPKSTASVSSDKQQKPVCVVKGTDGSYVVVNEKACDDEEARPAGTSSNFWFYWWMMNNNRSSNAYAPGARFSSSEVEAVRSRGGVKSASTKGAGIAARTAAKSAAAKSAGKSSSSAGKSGGKASSVGKSGGIGGKGGGKGGGS